MKCSLLLVISLQAENTTCQETPAGVANTLTGVYLGLFATGNGSSAQSHADFDYFEYKLQ